MSRCSAYTRIKSNCSVLVNMISNFMHLPASSSTPAIRFGPDGVISIEGVSIPLNAQVFYAKAMDWIKVHVHAQPLKPLHIRIKLTYLNTSTFRSLIELAETAKPAYESHPQMLTLEWVSEIHDMDMMERGQMFSMILSWPVMLKKE